MSVKQNFELAPGAVRLKGTMGNALEKTINNNFFIMMQTPIYVIHIFSTASIKIKFAKNFTFFTKMICILDKIGIYWK